ncbi:MAG: urea ABC transporter permease subunit UrtB [Rhodobacteraceae bacterium]|nr:urea ABC transporter permease subunit UrtB [Paracoccaceae bacterium]
MLRTYIRVLLLALLAGFSAPALQAQSLQDLSLQDALQIDAGAFASPSRRTVGATITALIETGHAQVPLFLQHWQAKELWQRDADGLFFYVTGDGPYQLIDIVTGEPVGTAEKSELSQIKPNAGVRRVIGAALVRFLLLDPALESRIAAVEAIERSPEAGHLEPLRASIAAEQDAALRARKTRLERIVTARFGTDPVARLNAIDDLAGDVSLDVRGVLSQILDADDGVATSLPEGVNIAQIRNPEAGYEELIEAGLAPAPVTRATIRAALEANITGETVGGVPVAELGTDEARATAYAALASQGLAPPQLTNAQRAAAVEAHVFYSLYSEPDAAITDAARAVREAIEDRVGWFQLGDLTLDGLSLASIYFLAAIGLAITFGVMGVINMAHGEFIMMGAYTGYVVQQYIPNYTVSILVALPLAFAVTFAAGVAMERLVIRWLYHRPLETLLATFGISIALQQLAKNIFGTQARPLTSPGWLDGAWVLNDVVSISYIRIAIFVLALICLAFLLFVLNRTRLGLEVRAVTQNPGMAASMGINPDKINMLTFGLGSGIAGIAGVAIGLYAKVTSELGADYIVQSFMTVVVGGVGNVWGALAGASLIGFLQKGIEWFNPSNTLAAQTYMILFIILFIQFRPKGIVALKGRAAGD